MYFTVPIRLNLTLSKPQQNLVFTLRANLGFTLCLLFKTLGPHGVNLGLLEV